MARQQELSCACVRALDKLLCSGDRKRAEICPTVVPPWSHHGPTVVRTAIYRLYTNDLVSDLLVPTHGGRPLMSQSSIAIRRIFCGSKSATTPLGPPDPHQPHRGYPIGPRRAFCHADAPPSIGVCWGSRGRAPSLIDPLNPSLAPPSTEESTVAIIMV